MRTGLGLNVQALEQSEEGGKTDNVNCFEVVKGPIQSSEVRCVSVLPFAHESSQTEKL